MQKAKKQRRDSLWSSTSFANIVRYQASGIYFARCRVAGKLIWRSLKTDRITVAKLRLDDLVKQERTKAEGVVAQATGKMSVEQCVEVYANRLKADTSWSFFNGDKGMAAIR